MGKKTVVVIVIVGLAGLIAGLWPTLSSLFKQDRPISGAACPVSLAPGQAAPPYYADSDDYAGPGPHPIVVVDTMDYHGRKQDGSPLDATWAIEQDGPQFYELPDSWQPPSPEPNSEPDYGPIQLIACVYYDKVSEPLTYCHYNTDNGSFGISSVEGTVVVRKANSGEVVHTFPLRSDPTKFRSTDVPRVVNFEYCRTSISGTAGPHTWLVPPSNADFLAGLRPVVDAKR